MQVQASDFPKKMFFFMMVLGSEDVCANFSSIPRTMNGLYRSLGHFVSAHWGLGGRHAADRFNPRPGMGSRITRHGRGGQNLPPPPANPAPMKARITEILWKVVWSNVSKMCNFGDPW